MSTTTEYLNSVLERISDIDGIAYRKMMGEYIVYFKDKLAGGIYDNRFLVKPVNAAKRLMPDAELEIPYSGAKEMLRVDDNMKTDFLRELFIAMYEELPEIKRRRKN